MMMQEIKLKRYDKLQYTVEKSIQLEVLLNPILSADSRRMTLIRAAIHFCCLDETEKEIRYEESRTP